MDDDGLDDGREEGCDVGLVGLYEGCDDGCDDGCDVGLVGLEDG